MSSSLRLGLMTIHHANSYGGVLQAYASKSVLQEFGDVSVIDYKSTHIRRTLELLRIADGRRGWLRAAKDVARLLPRMRLISKFNSFCKAHLDVDSDEASTFIQQGLDVAVAGSDQIWNPSITDGLDAKYFLSGILAKKKISFSTSFGSYKYSPHEQSVVRELLSDFSNIAVRERDAAAYLSDLLDRQVHETVDPTLLLNKSRWTLIASDQSHARRPYLLVYSLKEDALVRKVISTVAKQLKLSIVAINQNPFAGYPVDVHVKDAGPSEYLRLFLDASFVVTNSFHGTAFACNFAKPFLAVKPEHGMNRVSSLLDRLGLRDRLVVDATQIQAALAAEINWPDTQTRVESMRADARVYLDSALRA
jgi:hypothetical protein